MATEVSLNGGPGIFFRSRPLERRKTSFFKRYLLFIYFITYFSIGHAYVTIAKLNAPATLAVNKLHNAISKSCFMLVYISAHTIVKLILNKVLLL